MKYTLNITTDDLIADELRQRQLPVGLPAIKAIPCLIQRCEGATEVKVLVGQDMMAQSYRTNPSQLRVNLRGSTDFEFVAVEYQEAKQRFIIRYTKIPYAATFLGRLRNALESEGEGVMDLDSIPRSYRLNPKLVDRQLGFATVATLDDAKQTLTWALKGDA